MSKAASMAFQSLTIWKYGFIYTHVLDSFCLSSFLCLYVSLIFRSRFPKKNFCPPVHTNRLGWI